MYDSCIRVGAGREESHPPPTSRAGVGQRNLLDGHQRNYFDLKRGLRTYLWRETQGSRLGAPSTGLCVWAGRNRPLAHSEV